MTIIHIVGAKLTVGEFNSSDTFRTKTFIAA